MHILIYKLTQFILKLQNFLYKIRTKKLNSTFKNGSSKMIFHGENELILSAETELKKTELNKKIKEIVKTKLDDPEKLLNFISTEGTDVFRIKNANLILKLVGEEEGFITPAIGLKALFINLFVNLLVYNKLIISFKSNEMFILRPLKVDIYYMIHQFHKWYSYKLGLPGFNFKEQENFKHIFKTLKQEDISNLTLSEIISLKEAIARDIEAIDFVVNLCKEFDTSKKLLNRIKTGNSVVL